MNKQLKELENVGRVIWVATDSVDWECLDCHTKWNLRKAGDRPKEITADCKHINCPKSINQPYMNKQEIEEELWYVIANWGRNEQGDVLEALARAYNLSSELRGENQKIKRVKGGWKFY